MQVFLRIFCFFQVSQILPCYYPVARPWCMLWRWVLQNSIKPYVGRRQPQKIRETIEIKPQKIGNEQKKNIGKNEKVIKDENIEIRIDILLANVYIKKRKYEKAENILLLLIKKYERMELAYLNLSILYRDKNQLSKSIEILNPIWC